MGKSGPFCTVEHLLLLFKKMITAWFAWVPLATRARAGEHVLPPWPHLFS